MKPSLSQLKRLVGSPDAYALQQKDGTWRPVREPLTDAVLRRHLSLGHTVGIYTVWKDQARTLVFDVDSGEDAERELVLINVALEDLGFPESCHASEVSGKKGFHEWVVIQEYRPAAELRRVGRAVLAMAGVQCEVAPKQDSVRDGGLGNLVKAPGGKHQVTGVHNDFIGVPPTPLPVALWKSILAKLPEEQHARRSGPVDSRFPCMEAIQEGVSEGGRNIQLVHLGAMMRRSGISQEYAELILRSVNGKCEPPVDEDELEGIIRQSDATGPLCDQLPPDRRCGEYCIKERIKGLHTLPRQLANASDGECVVVRLRQHTGDIVVLEHEDLEQAAKGAVRKST